MTTYYKTIRIDSDDPPLVIVEQLDKLNTKYWIQFEIATITKKPHWQGWILQNQKSEHSILRKSLKELYGKSKYSYGERNGDSYLSYIYNNPDKGRSERYYTNYTTEELDALEIPVYIDKRKKSTKEAIISKIYDSCIDSVLQDGKLDYIFLSESIVQYCHENSILQDSYSHKRYFISLAIKIELEHNLDLKVYKAQAKFQINKDFFEFISFK